MEPAKVTVVAAASGYRDVKF